MSSEQQEVLNGGDLVNGSGDNDGFGSLQFDFANSTASSTSFGHYLKNMYKGSGTSVIQSHFDNESPVPASLPPLDSYDSISQTQSQQSQPQSSQSIPQQLIAPLSESDRATSVPEQSTTSPASRSPQDPTRFSSSLSPDTPQEASDVAPQTSSSREHTASFHPQQSEGLFQSQAQQMYQQPQQSSPQSQQPMQLQAQQPIATDQSTQSQQIQQHHNPLSIQPHPGATVGTSQELAPAQSSIVTAAPDNQQYADITEYLSMPQSEAAKRLGIPASTLSKRWKEAARNRKWPWRTVCKVDKEITTLLHNIPPGGPIPPEIEEDLGLLLRRRQEELKPVVIRL